MSVLQQGAELVARLTASAHGQRGSATAGQHPHGGWTLGEHLGKWEKGEACKILSRDTYANNKHLVDELIDTSLHRGGAPVRQRDGYYEDGGTFTSGDSSGASTVSSARADSQELIQAVKQVETAIKALPSWVRIYWDQDDDAALEERLDGRAEDRAAGQVR